MPLFKDTLSPARREAWDAVTLNPAAVISADPDVAAAAAKVDEATAAYTAARQSAAKRLYP